MIDYYTRKGSDKEHYLLTVYCKKGRSKKERKRVEHVLNRLSFTIDDYFAWVEEKHSDFDKEVKKLEEEKKIEEEVIKMEDKPVGTLGDE